MWQQLRTTTVGLFVGLVLKEVMGGKTWGSLPRVGSFLGSVRGPAAVWVQILLEPDAVTSEPEMFFSGLHFAYSCSRALERVAAPCEAPESGRNSLLLHELGSCS